MSRMMMTCPECGREILTDVPTAEELVVCRGCHAAFEAATVAQLMDKYQTRRRAWMRGAVVIWLVVILWLGAVGFLAMLLQPVLVVPAAGVLALVCFFALRPLADSMCE